MKKYVRPGFEIEAGYGGAIAMMLVPDDIAEEIVQWSSKNIKDDEVYGKDGKGRDGSPHVTLQNGIMCDDVSELELLFDCLSEMEAELGPVSVFRQDDKDYDVVHVEVICDDLRAANSMISELLEVNNPHKDYSPHVTLAYVKKGSGARFDGLEDFVGKKMPLGRLMIDGPGIEPRSLSLKRKERKDVLPGGKADYMSESDFNAKDLEEGARHELEHTKNIDIAREIAMDHLAEDPKYYKKLKKIEAKKKRRYARYEAEDLEDYLLDSGRSVRGINSSDIGKLIRDIGDDSWE